MVTVFFSYSHRDEDLRNELEIHLSTLKRQGVIQTWHDRRIGAGKDLADEIDSNIETADVILFLVSPYFIASDYCYNVEMQRALERHKNGEARVIPVILHPCEWQQTPFGNLRATPTDGKPVSKYPNQHDALLSITKDIRRVVEEISEKAEIETKKLKSPFSKSITEPKAKITKKLRSSNLRIRKKYTDIERSRFMAESFEYFANFFENSLVELGARAADLETEFRRIDANHFTAAIYAKGSLVSRCKIWLESDIYSPGEIRYSPSVSIRENSWNNSLHVDDDGYVLGLKTTMGFHRMGYNSEILLSKEGGAEFFWSILIEPLQ